MTNCFFCTVRDQQEKILFDTEHFFLYADDFPVNPGHTTIISKRHVSDLFGLHADEWKNLQQTIHELKQRLDKEFHPDGYNIGINNGAAAGQSVFHLHIHCIPRYTGDVENPRGGVRNIKPPLVPLPERYSHEQ